METVAGMGEKDYHADRAMSTDATSMGSPGIHGTKREGERR